MHLQALIWYRQRRLREAKSEASHALEVFEKLGAVKDAEVSRDILQEIQEAMERQSTSVDSDNGGEFLETAQGFVLQPLTPFLLAGGTS